MFNWLYRNVIRPFRALFRPKNTSSEDLLEVLGMKSVPIDLPEQLKGMVMKADRVEVFFGMPRLTYKEEVLFKQKYKTFEWDEFDFIDEPLQLSYGVIEQITVYYLSEAPLYYTLGRQKMCGGYHPDYLIRWWCGDKAVWVGFCFGCGEMKAIYEGETLIHCDMRAYSMFKQPLDEAGAKLYVQ